MTGKVSGFTVVSIFAEAFGFLLTV